MRRYCEEFGYKPDYVNESPSMNTKKPYYNIPSWTTEPTFKQAANLAVVIMKKTIIKRNEQ